MKTQRTSIIAALVALAGLGSACAAAAVEPDRRPPDLNDTDDLRAFVDGVVQAQMDDKKIPAAVVAIVKDGRTILLRGYGHSDPAQHLPVDPVTSEFRIASTSKLFTWTAVMQLVEQHKIDLDADVNRYLKSFKLPATYPQPITMRHLMTHTAGFEDAALGYAQYLYGQNRLESADPATVTANQFVPARIMLGAHIPQRVRPPGVMFAYSNYGASLAGFIVEEVSGEPFTEYIRRHILVPLGMPRTTFEEPPPQPLHANLVPGFRRADGVYEPHRFLFMGAFRPQGAATTTADDMAHFMLAHLDEGQYLDRRILQPQTVRQMHSPAFGLDPRLQSMCLGFFELRLGAVRTIAHGGDIPGYNSIVALAPEQHVGVFVSYASDSGSSAREQFLRAFFGRYYPQDPQESHKRVPASAPAVSSAQYAGHYLATRRNHSTIEMLFSLLQQVSVSELPGGRLQVNAGDDEPWVFAPVGDGLFTQIGGNYRLLFRQDAHGQVTHLFFDFLAIPPTERAAWYESSAFWGPVWGVSLLLAVVTLIHWVASRRQNPHMPDPQRRATRLAAATCGWLLLTLVVMGVIVGSSGEDFFLRLPMAFKIVLVMPLLFVALTLCLVWTAVQSWRRRYWSVSRRLFYTATTLAMTSISLFLYQWNVLGWQY